MSVANPTMKDTKQTILLAYQGVLEKLKAASANVVDPTAANVKAQVDVTIAKADGTLTSENLERFRTGLTSSLGQLRLQMDEVLEEYTAVKNAVELKKQELEDVYGIEKEAHTLAALIDAQRELEEENDNNRANFYVEFDKEKASVKAALMEEIEEQRAANNRNQEEFEYDFKRRKQAASDQLTDELTLARKRHKETVEGINKELEERQANLTAAEENRAELETKIEAMPEVIAEEVRKQVGKEKGMLERKHADEIKFLTSESAGKLAVIDSQRQAAANIIEDLKAKNDDLSSKLDKAYHELRELAQATVAGPSLSDLKEIAGAGGKK